MRHLELYPSAQYAPVERIVGAATDSACILCPLSEKAKSVCISPEGEPDGLLVVGDYPQGAENLRGRPFVTGAGAKLRRVIRRFWDGPVALDYAVKCHPSGRRVTDTMTSACRRYLARTIKEVRPKRILTLGPIAMQSVLGRGAAPMSVRRGFGWLESSTTPVFSLMTPSVVLQNRFLAEWLEKDLQWAITANPLELRFQSSRDGCACLIETEQEARDAVTHLYTADWVAYDTETVGRTFDSDFEVVSIAIAARASEDSFVWSGTALTDKKVLQPLLDLLADPEQKVVAQNAKYDANAIFAAFGVNVQGLYLDTRLVRKLLEPEAQANLATMQELVGMGGGKEIADEAISTVVKSISKAETEMEMAMLGPLDWVKPIAEKRCVPAVYAYGLIPPDIRDRYCARDTISTTRLAELFEKQLKDSDSLDMVWEEIVRPAARAIEHIERWGLCTDRDAIQKFSESVEYELCDVVARLKAEGDWNLNATREVQNFLYEKHSLPVLKRTNGGAPSTDKATLEMLLSKTTGTKKYQMVGDLLAYRRLSKLLSTYASKFESFIRDDGRVHPNFNLTGARSGRISCSDPNVQQIPRSSTRLGAMARDCFIAPKGRVLIQLDYSQLELRIVAMLSNDSNMLDVFRSGQDYHLRTAQLIAKQAWGISPDDVDKSHRTAAKAVNFGLLYGMSVSTLAKNIDCSKQDAQKIQNAIFGSFPNLKRWCDAQLKIARVEGKSYTYWRGKRARVRPMFRIADHDDSIRSKAEHGSWNTPVQGSASDLCLASLARCTEWILSNRFPTKLVLTVHDSLLFEVEQRYAGELVDTMGHLMTDWSWVTVPLVVDAEIGTSWGGLESL